MNAQHLASLDALIAYHENSAAALRQARAVVTGEEGGALQAEVKLLTGPKPRRQKQRRPRKPTQQARGSGEDDEDLVTMELEGADVAVTPLQEKILELLGESDGYFTAQEIGEKLGLSASRVKYIIHNLQKRIADADCKAQVNGYRNRGFRLEVESADE